METLRRQALADEPLLNGPLRRCSGSARQTLQVDQTRELVMTNLGKVQNLRKALGVALVLGATALALPASTTSTAAMPLAGLDDGVVRDGQTAGIDQVRWVCGPYRCHWAPNYYYGYGPGWGYRRGWGGGWRGRRW
jgi:hypothetical protein